jgi:hypothetical protein
LQLKDTTERIKSVDTAAALVEEMMKQGPPPAGTIQSGGETWRFHLEAVCKHERLYDIDVSVSAPSGLLSTWYSKCLLLIYSG